MKNLYKLCIFVVVFIYFFTFIKPSYTEEDAEESIEENIEYEYYKASISEFKGEVEEGGTMLYKIKAVFSEGPYEDKIVELEYRPVIGTSYDIDFREGMSIIVSLKFENGKIDKASIFDVNRRDTTKVLTIIFVCILILLGGFKGILSVLSLVVTFLLIIFLLIPLILNGTDPILATITVCSISILISFILISGFSKKSFCAIISTVGGTIIAGLCAYYFGNMMGLTGLCDSSVQTLVTQTDIVVNYKGLLFSGIILGTVGAVMDIGMSITSFIFEMKAKNPKITSISLFKSGMSVGKDIMSTMTNTLILAYAGASLPLFLYFVNMDNSFISVINMEFISEEILRSLCGSIGLVLTIPLTSLIASLKA